MDKIQEIKEYINTMKIKKTIFGGYDREDVYSKLGIITEMYQKYIEEVRKSEESMRKEYAQRIRKSEEDIAKLQQRIGVLLNENQAIVDAKETALEEKKTAIKARDAAIEEKKAGEDEKKLLQQESRKQQEQLGMQQSEISKQQKQLSEQQEELAKRQKQIEELQEIQDHLEQEKISMKQSYKAYCSNVLQQYSESLRTLSTEFSQILENVTNLQKAVVEAEAMDIFEVTEEETKAIEESSKIEDNN